MGVKVNVGNGTARDVGNNGVLYHVLNAVLVSLPVCVKGEIACNGEYAVGIFLTVGCGCVGNVEPTAEGVAFLGKLGGKGESIADCEILSKLTCESAACKSYLVCGNLHSNPVAIDIGASYLDEVGACLGKSDLCGSSIRYCNSLFAINSYLVCVASESGSPVNGAVVVGEVACECAVTDGDRCAECRCHAVLDGSYFNGVALTVGKLKSDCSSKIKRRLGGCIGLSADLDLVLLCSGCVPADNKAVRGHSGGSCGNLLSCGCFGCLGGVVAVGHGGNLNGDLAVEGSGAEEVLRGGVGVGAVCGNNYNVVACGVLYCAPYEAVLLSLVNDAVDSVECEVVSEGLGGGACIAVCCSGNGEYDTALLHRTAAEVVVGGHSYVEHSMLVRCVSAGYGNVISLCILNALEYEKTVDYAERGNSCECLVLVMSYTYFGIVFCVGGFGSYLNDVVACVLCGKVKIAECGCACRTGIKNVSVLIGNLNAVGCVVSDALPTDCLVADGNYGSGELFSSVLVPYCVKGGISIEHCVLGIYVGELRAILVHTYEPAAELVAKSFGGGNAVELAVNGSHCGKSVCALVAKVKVNCVLGSAEVLSNPACVYGRIRLDDCRCKVERCLKSRVGVPADKRVVLLLGILGLGCILSVKDALRVKHRAAH